MKLTNDQKLRASVLMLRGDQYVVGNSLMFMLEGKYCVVQMIGPANTCKRVEATNWSEALVAFENFANGGTRA